MLPKRCRPCYYSGGGRSCDFYLITGIRNPYSPEECPHFKEGKRQPNLPQDFVKIGGYSKEKDPRYNGFYTAIEQLYNEGKNDKEIAEDLGCSPRSVSAWRARHGLPSQRDIERMRKK